MLQYYRHIMNSENKIKGRFLSLLRSSREKQQAVSKPERRYYGLLETPNVPLDVEQLHYNVYLVGKAGIGKSFFVSWLAGLELPYTYYATNGMQSTTVTCVCQLHSTSEKKLMFCIEFWESGATGKRQPSDLLMECPRNTDAVIMFFSYAEKENFKILPEIMSECNKIDSCRPCFIAVGVRWNPEEMQCIRQKDIKQFEHHWKVPVIQTPFICNGNEYLCIKEASLLFLCEELCLRDQILSSQGIAR